MQVQVRFDAATLLSNRPFTHPEHTARDEAILCLILERLRQLDGASLSGSEPTSPVAVPWGPEPNCPHRIVIGNPSLLWTETEMEVVGFFGQRRTNADSDSLGTSDEVLLLEFTNHPGMLCYCSYRMPCGNYGNLVLFHDHASKLDWSRGVRHAYVARALSPGYYHSVRLHNGRLPGGIVGGRNSIVTCTKYFDYDGVDEANEPWRGLREYEDPCSSNGSVGV